MIPLEQLPHELDRSAFTCQAIVEAPAGSRVKVYYDADSHRFRIGKFLPYYSHAKLSIDGTVANTVPTSCPAGYPAACGVTVRTLSAAVGSLKYSGLGQGEQTTDSIGVRWDFYRSVALKAQVDRVRPNAGNGLLINAQSGFKGPVTVGAVALDFVF